MISIGAHRSEIDTPALLVDLDVMERNIATMADFFRQRPAKLRPHFKSPKSPAIAQRLLAAGAIGMTCAKVGEAEVLVEHGFRDILIANQVVGKPKLRRLVALAERADVMVAVDSLAGVEMLEKAVRQAGVSLRVLVEVDVGMHRCGVRSQEDALALARRIATGKSMRMAGLMGYEGHAVMQTDRAERRRMVDAAIGKLLATADHLRAAGVDVDIVSAGGTGTYDMTGTIPGITEIQAGSFVLMDGRYHQVDIPFDCALTLLATVVSVPDHHTAIIDAGMKSITFELGRPAVKDRPGVTLQYLSEEHGHLAMERRDLEVGHQVELIPSHSDTTINLHDWMFGLRNDRVEEIFRIEARGKFT